MVKRIFIFLAYVTFFMLSLMYFTPKISIYYFLETQLKPYDVVISSELLQDKGLSLNIQDASVSLKAIESAKIKDLNIMILGLYNSVEVSDVELSSAAASFVPLKVQKIDMSYHAVNPLNANAHAIGEFGEAEVSLNLLERTLHVRLIPSALMKKEYKHTLRNLKKSENGEFTYDKTF